MFKHPQMEKIMQKFHEISSLKEVPRVVMMGMTQTGKSTLVRRLVGGYNFFPVGDGTKAKTKFPTKFRMIHSDEKENGAVEFWDTEKNSKEPLFSEEFASIGKIVDFFNQKDKNEFSTLYETYSNVPDKKYPVTVEVVVTLRTRNASQFEIVDIPGMTSGEWKQIKKLYEKYCKDKKYVTGILVTQANVSFESNFAIQEAVKLIDKENIFCVLTRLDEIDLGKREDKVKKLMPKNNECNVTQNKIDTQEKDFEEMMKGFAKVFTCSLDFSKTGKSSPDGVVGGDVTDVMLQYIEEYQKKKTLKEMVEFENKVEEDLLAPYRKIKQDEETGNIVYFGINELCMFLNGYYFSSIKKYIQLEMDGVQKGYSDAENALRECQKHYDKRQSNAESLKSRIISHMIKLDFSFNFLELRKEFDKLWKNLESVNLSVEECKKFKENSEQTGFNCTQVLFFESVKVFCKEKVEKLKGFVNLAEYLDICEREFSRYANDFVDTDVDINELINDDQFKERYKKELSNLIREFVFTYSNSNKDTSASLFNPVPFSERLKGLVKVFMNQVGFSFWAPPGESKKQWVLVKEVLGAMKFSLEDEKVHPVLNDAGVRSCISYLDNVKHDLGYVTPKLLLILLLIIVE